MDNGKLICGRYLLVQLIKQGPPSDIYFGFDQLFQRNVVIKVVDTIYAADYRAAVKMTSHFSHPNIVNLYDLVSQPNKLYLVQEHIIGSNLTAFLTVELTAFEIANIGRQISIALLYAHNTVCHGDLTPSAILREQSGSIRINNFALPCDQNYFKIWSVLGGQDTPISDPNLSAGAISKGRIIDDTRAIGLILYQLAANPSPGTTVVVPPYDGRLRFKRNIPLELCRIILRTVIRQHPQSIVYPQELYTELTQMLKTLHSQIEILPQTQNTIVKSDQQTSTLKSVQEANQIALQKLLDNHKMITDGQVIQKPDQISDDQLLEKQQQITNTYGKLSAIQDNSVIKLPSTQDNSVIKLPNTQDNSVIKLPSTQDNSLKNIKTKVQNRYSWAIIFVLSFFLFILFFIIAYLTIQII